MSNIIEEMKTIPSHLGYIPKGEKDAVLVGAITQKAIFEMELLQKALFQISLMQVDPNLKETNAIWLQAAIDISKAALRKSK